MSDENRTALGGIPSTEVLQETVVKGIADHVSCLISKAVGSELRLGSLKYRLMGMPDEKKPEEDAAEPVRQDIEELTYRLSNLEAALDRIAHHTSDLERL